MTVNVYKSLGVNWLDWLHGWQTLPRLHRWDRSRESYGVVVESTAGCL